MNKVIHKSFFATIPVLVGFLVIPNAFADNTDVVDQVSITVPVSCTMSGTGMNTHNAEIANGTYTADIGITTLKAFCNDNEGFAIYAIGFTGDEYGATNLVGASTGSTFTTGTATSAGNPDVSNWAMKLATNSNATYPITLDNGYSSYSVVPDTYTKVAHRDAGTDTGTSATGTELTTTYAAYISKTQPADTYTGKVKYTLVHPSTEIPLQPQTTQAGKICYYPNGSNVEGTMGCQTIPDSGTTDRVSPTSATLLASNFSRTGYGFAGWNDQYDYSGNFYGPNETITYTEGQYSGANNGLSLYAVWVKSVGSIQDTNTVASTCGSLTTAPTDGTANLRSVTAFTDQRDNETYAVARLADGNCWMIENLRLENTAEHNPDGSLAQGYNSSFIGLADPEPDDFSSSNSTTANSLYSTDSSTAATIQGDSQGYRFPRYFNHNNQSNSAGRPQNPTANSAMNNTTKAGMYSYGNYYTWAAAIADTTDYSSDDHNTTSICPTGWRIPTGKTSGEYYALNTVINSGSIEDATASNKLRSYPNNFLFSGSPLSNKGYRGFYWSSTALGNGTSYYFVLDSSYVRPGDLNSTKNSGTSIRCVMPGL